MQDAPIDGMRRDIVLAGYIEPPVRVGNDLLMDVAVRAADVHVRARVVRNEPRVVTAPRAGQILRWANPRRIAGAEHRDRRSEYHCVHPHRTPLPAVTARVLDRQMMHALVRMASPYESTPPLRP